MLDKIQGAQTDVVGQSTSLDRIKELELKSTYSTNESGYIVDESEISDIAYERYNREQDVKKFSKILLETDEKEAQDLVLQKTFDGTISIDDDEFMADLLNNSDLLNEIF